MSTAQKKVIAIYVVWLAASYAANWGIGRIAKRAMAKVAQA